MSTGRLERTLPLFRQLAEAADLLEADVSVLVKPLTPEEAIGRPGRRTFPILVGKERVIEARVGSGRGHAFTDSAREFLGLLAEVLDLPLDRNSHRAIYLATLNALLRHLGRVDGTVHCRDDDPERCGEEIARTLRRRWGEPRVGLIGFNPAIAEALVRAVGAGHVFFTDLDPDCIGEREFGVEVWDGVTRADELIDAADVVLLTGSTLVNATFDPLWDRINERGKVGLVFGVTAAGVCELLGLERICPCGRNG